MPKKFGCAPAASTSTSPAKRVPSAVVTVCVARSTDTTAAVLTETEWSLAKMPRSDRAMSPTPSWAVAT